MRRLSSAKRAPPMVRDDLRSNQQGRDSRRRHATKTALWPRRAVLRRGPTSDSRPTRPDDRPTSFPIQPGGGDPKAGESKKRVYRKLAGALVASAIASSLSHAGMGRMFTGLKSFSRRQRLTSDDSLCGVGFIAWACSMSVLRLRRAGPEKAPLRTRLARRAASNQAE